MSDEFSDKGINKETKTAILAGEKQIGNIAISSSLLFSMNNAATYDDYVQTDYVQLFRKNNYE